MAYGLKYYTDASSNLGSRVFIQILKDGYVDPSTYKLNMTPGGFKVDYKPKDWFSPIIGQSCTLEVINEFDNWYDLEDLMTLNEKEFQIRAFVYDPSGGVNQVFTGWVDSNTVSQKYLHNSTFRLTASNYLSKIGDIDPSIIETKEKRSLIDIFNSAIQNTGQEFPIRVNCRLDPSSGTPLPSNKTLFNTAGLDTEVFWEDNVERVGSVKTIEQILRPFDCFLYPYNNKWYIERYADMLVDASGVKSYVNYSFDNSYGYNDTRTTSVESDSSTDLNDLTFLERSQTISMIPGLNYIDINLNQKPYLNYTTYDFHSSTFEGVNTVTSPPIRAWQYNEYNITEASEQVARWDLGKAYKDIENVAYVGVLATASWFNDYDWNENENLRGYGLATKFALTVIDASDGPTEINFKWKWNNRTKYGNSHWWGNKNGYVKNYRLYWTLRVPPTGKYIKYDSDEERWYLSGEILAADGAEYIEISPESCNQDTGTYEASITVDLSDPSVGLTGDQTMVFSINNTTHRFESPSVAETSWERSNQIGDVEITVTTPQDDNLIRTTLSKDVLNKQEIDFDIFDTDNLNYKNCIYTKNGYSTRTNLWTDSSTSSTYYPLYQWYIHDKYQLFNKNRRMLKANIKYAGFLKPMQQFYDSLDPSTRTYLLMGYTYIPDKDEYNCQFWEHDISDEINFL